VQEDDIINEESTNERYVHFPKISHETFQRIDIIFDDQEVVLVLEDYAKYFSTQKDDRVVDNIVEIPNGLDSTEEYDEDTQLEALRIILRDFQQECEEDLHSESPLEVIDPY